MRDLEIFHQAPEGASPEELAAYLDQACGDDAALRARVDALFASDRKTLGLVGQVPRALRAGLEPQGGHEGGWEQAGEAIGPYKLLQKIGEGGFGVVYMAEQVQPVRRRVALKIIKQGMDTRQVIARFEAERQALAMMEHPNIAKVLDAGATESGRPYFVMELVRGTPITAFCDEESLDTHQRLALFQDVCSAVGHAHQKGIIHRDLKPSNILVGRDGDLPIVKVIDFGVAKAAQLQLTDKTLFTRFEQFIGTPLYISPEQASLSPIDIDTRSDIYSLGVLLYELLTGKPPIDQEELMRAGFDEMRRLIREQEPPKPSTRLSTATEDERRTIARARHTEPRKLGLFIKGDLDWIVLKALEKDRKRRYDTAAALRRDIEHFLHDEVVTATPPSAGYKFQKFARRNKGALVAAAAVALALIAGTIVSTSQWSRAEKSASRAETEAEAAQRARDAEKAQRALAEQRLRESALSDRVMASDLAARGREPDALVYLARSCRNDPKAAEAFQSSVELLRSWEHPRVIAGLREPLDGGLFFFEDERIAWSPDGLRVAICGNERNSTASRAIGRVWSTETGEVVLSFAPESENDTVAVVGFDPAGNCLLLVCPSTPDATGPVRIWDSGTQRYRATLEGAGWQGGFQPAAFSDDGSLVLFEELPVDLAEGKEENPRIGVWNTAEGQKIASLEQEPAATSARFSPDGTRVLLTLKGGRTTVWNVASSQEVAAVEGKEVNEDGSLAVVDDSFWNVEQNEELQPLEGVSIPALRKRGIVHSAEIFGWVGRRAVELEATGRFSPDDLRFASFNLNIPGYCVWNTETGRLLQTIPTSMVTDSDESRPTKFQPHHQHQFSRDGRLLATFDRGQTKIWDTRSGDLLGTLPVEGARFSPDGRRIMTSDFRIWEWNTRGLDRPLPQGDYVLSKDGRLISTSGGAIRVFSVGEGTELARWEASSPVGRAAVSADGSLLATSHRDRTVQVWNLESRALVHRWKIERGNGGDEPFFSPDGKTLGVWTRMPSRRYPDGKVIWQGLTLFYDLETGDLRGELPTLVGPCFSPDGTRIVVEAKRAMISVFASDDLELLAEYPLPENGHSRNLGFRPDGSGPLMLTYEGELLDLETGEAAISGKLGRGASSFCFSPDGKKVAVFFERRDLVRTFDSETGEDLGEVTAWEWQVLSRQDWYLEEKPAAALRLRLEPEPELRRWWGDFLILVSQRHFNNRGELSNLPTAEAERMRRDLLAVLAGDDSKAAEVARWWLAPAEKQGIHVGSSRTASEYADQRIKVGATDEELEQAYRLSPAHPLIHLALVGTTDSHKQARFLAEYSLQRLPDDPELKRRAEELQASHRLLLAQLAVNAVLQSDPDFTSEATQERFARLGEQQLEEAVDSLERFRTAVALAAGESAGSYERFCREWARVDADDPDPIVRKRIRLAAMLRPTAATRAIWQELPSRRRDQEIEDWAKPWFDLTEALGAHRRGDWEHALECLERTEQPIPDALSANGTLPILFTLLEAMAHQQGGNEDDAQTLFADARTAMPGMREANPYESTHQWQDRLLCELFLAQGERLIAPQE